ncbi:MAG: hypothetical protein MJZ19_05565 [Paludibacteraceae bacterium]|nr:hypothetical protein [Paludibacteraceae bacterium]
MRKLLFIFLTLFLSVNTYSENNKGYKPLSTKAKSEILTTVFNHKELLRFFDDSLSYGYSKRYVIKANDVSDLELKVYSKGKKFEIEKMNQDVQNGSQGEESSIKVYEGWKISFCYDGGTVNALGSLDGYYEGVAFNYILRKVNGRWVIKEDASWFFHVED